MVVVGYCLEVTVIFWPSDKTCGFCFLFVRNTVVDSPSDQIYQEDQTILEDLWGPVKTQQGCMMNEKAVSLDYIQDMSEHLRMALCAANVLETRLRVTMSQKHKFKTLPEVQGPHFLPVSQDFQVFPI